MQSTPEIDDIKEFTSFVADINLGDASQTTIRHPAVFLKIVGAGTGTIVVLMATNDGVPTNRTLSVVNGDIYWGRFAKIISAGTTVTKVQVGWAEP